MYTCVCGDVVGGRVGLKVGKAFKTNLSVRPLLL